MRYDSIPSPHIQLHVVSHFKNKWYRWDVNVSRHADVTQLTRPDQASRLSKLDSHQAEYPTVNFMRVKKVI